MMLVKARRVEENTNSDLVICEFCESVMYPLWENTGFSPPDPAHMEMVGYECRICGNKKVRGFDYRTYPAQVQ